MFLKAVRDEIIVVKGFAETRDAPFESLSDIKLS
jgi:hypothetical protein